MTRKCKICESKLRNDIDELLLSNQYNAEYISNYANDRGLVISASTVRRHGTLHVTGYNPSTSEVRKLDKKEPKFILIDFDEYLLSLGIDRKVVENIDEYLDENITGYQKGVNLLMFKSLAVLNDKIDQCMKGDNKYPSDEIKALKSLSEIYNKSLGLDKFIDENTALQHLESLGYQVTQKTIDVESS